MSNTITFNQYALQKLFVNFFRIPDYQREFVWQEGHVTQLINDIYESFSSNPKAEYFLGSIVVCKSKEASHIFEVIDGQQRLITLSLIINNLKRLQKSSPALHKLLYDETIDAEGKTVPSYKVEIQYEGKNVFYDLCEHENDDELDLKMVEGLPGKTIFEAHKTIHFLFEEYFKKDDTELRDKFVGYFLNNVVLIQIETPEIGNALKIFETINERGVSLDQVDLLKNLLFQHVSRQEFPKLKIEWDKFKTSLTGQKIQEKPLRFLRYYTMANYEIEKDDKGDRILREDQLYTWLTKNERKVNYKSDTFAFIRRMQESATFYMDLIRSRYHNVESTNLENINNLVGSGFKQHFILLLSAKGLKPEQFNHLLAQLETLLFYYNITKEAPRDVEKKFSAWTEEIRKVKTNKNLNEFIENRMKTDIENRSRLFELNFMSLRFSSMQKYKLKYLLAKIAQHIDAMRMGDDENRSIDQYLKQSIHIEHILPEDPAPELVQDFSDGNKTEYNDYMTRLGNLTLLEKPINESVQRDFFDIKRAEYKKSNIYLTKSIAILERVGKNTSINRTNEYLTSFDKWNKESIQKRQQLLLNLANEVWQVKPID